MNEQLNELLAWCLAQGPCAALLVTLCVFPLWFADGSRDLPEETSPNSMVTTSQAVPNTTGTTRNPTRGARRPTPQGGPPITATARTGAGTTAT